MWTPSTRRCTMSVRKGVWLPAQFWRPLLPLSSHPPPTLMTVRIPSGSRQLHSIRWHGCLPPSLLRLPLSVMVPRFCLAMQNGCLQRSVVNHRPSSSVSVVGDCHICLTERLRPPHHGPGIFCTALALLHRMHLLTLPCLSRKRRGRRMALMTSRT